MIIVGELINASRKAVGEAIEKKDGEAVRKIAKDEWEAGSHYIDVNAGIFVGKEPEYLTWLVEEVQAAVDAPCAIDSPDPEAIHAALKVHKGVPLINSISLEKARYDKLLPVIAGTDFKVVALCMSDEGMPETTAQRLSIADQLVNRLVQNGILLDNIYVDPLVQPVATNSRFGVEFLEAIAKIMEAFPGIHTMCGLSNISYGLPERKFLNQAFMVMAIAYGLDGAIINPLDARMMANIVAAEALAGKDNFCVKYLKAFRGGKFKI